MQCSWKPNFGETIGYTQFKDGPTPQSAEGTETSEGMQVPENPGDPGDDTSSAPFLGGGLVISAIAVASNMFMWCYWLSPSQAMLAKSDGTYP